MFQRCGAPDFKIQVMSSIISTITSTPRAIITFVGETRQELKKVQWPTRQETVRSTIVILAVSVAVAIVTGAADYALTWVVENVLLKG